MNLSLNIFSLSVPLQRFVLRPTEQYKQIVGTTQSTLPRTFRFEIQI
jgi:hypothetical protein